MMASWEKLGYVSKALHWLPQGTPCKTRLAKRILGPCLDLRDAVVHGRDGIKYVTPSLREPVGFYLLIDGVYEVQGIDFVLKRVKARVRLR
jgi:hypothetical protein